MTCLILTLNFENQDQDQDQDLNQDSDPDLDLDLDLDPDLDLDQLCLLPTIIFYLITSVISISYQYCLIDWNECQAFYTLFVKYREGDLNPHAHTSNGF